MLLEKNVRKEHSLQLRGPSQCFSFPGGKPLFLSEEDKTSPKSQSPDARPGGPGRPRGWAVAAGAWPPDGPTCLPILSSMSTADTRIFRWPVQLLFIT